MLVFLGLKEEEGGNGERCELRIIVFFFFLPTAGLIFHSIYIPHVSQSPILGLWSHFIPLYLSPKLSIFLWLCLFMSDFSSLICWYWSDTGPASHLFQYCCLACFSYIASPKSLIHSLLSNCYQSIYPLSIYTDPPLCSFRLFPGQAAWPLQLSTSLLPGAVVGGVCLWPFPSHKNFHFNLTLWVTEETERTNQQKMCVCVCVCPTSLELPKQTDF